MSEGSGSSGMLEFIQVNVLSLMRLYNWSIGMSPSWLP